MLPVPSTKLSCAGLPNELSIELPERLSIRLSKELSKGLSETAATIYKLIYADNYITRGDIAKKVGISVTAVQKHVNKLKSIRLLDREGSASHGHWIIIEAKWCKCGAVKTKEKEQIIDIQSLALFLK